MTIKKAATCINAFIVCAILVTFGVFFSLRNTVNELMQVQTDRNMLTSLSEELRQSSRGLTSHVRMFAIIGDRRFERDYQNVLDRRAGKAPRLASDKLFPGEKHVLLDLFERYGITSEEMKHIREAERLSAREASRAMGALAQQAQILGQLIVDLKKG